MRFSLRRDTPARFGVAIAQPDLPGDWQTRRMRGGRGSARGCLVEPASAEVDAQRHLQAIERARRRRGYLDRP